MAAEQSLEKPVMSNNAPQASRWLSSIAVMLTTIMVILDMTIVNVALPHMMGSLGATADQITWVLTSFIVAEAVVIPLTGFLAGRFGRKRVMLLSITGFIIASGLCGSATSLAEMVLFRILQGCCGAPLVPLSQSVMVDTFPKEERGKAMAFWGMGIMLAPIMGPTLGGYITQHLEWRWIFYINLPVGLLNLLLVSRVLHESEIRKRHADILGALLMMVGIGSLQIVLDRGNQEGWFSSDFITVLTLVGSVTLAAFVIREWRQQDSIVNLRLFKDRNLAAASFIILAFGFGMFGTIAIQPIMLERLLDYPVETTGLVMAPRAVGSALSMLLVSRLIARVDSRILVGIGLLLSSVATHLMTWYNLAISPFWIIWPGAIQGLGIGMIFVPLSTLAYETLPKNATDAAAGLYNLARTIGSSIGISIASTLFARFNQFYWNQLGGQINPYNPALYAWLQAQGVGLDHPLAPQLLSQLLLRQSTMMAFVEVFSIISISFLLLAPLLLMVHRPAKKNSAGDSDTDLHAAPHSRETEP